MCKGSKIPFTPKDGRFGDNNFLMLLNRENVFKHNIKLDNAKVLFSKYATFQGKGYFVADYTKLITLNCVFCTHTISLKFRFCFDLSRISLKNPMGVAFISR